MGRLKIKRRTGKRRVDGKTFRLADEVGYIQSRAAERDGRIVAVGSVMLFSTETGDAWILDPSDQLATPLARDGDPLPAHIEDTDMNFAVGWEGNYRIEGELFIYRDKDSGNTRTIFGYPAERIAEQISKMSG
jgi:hypothetical protein